MFSGIGSMVSGAAKSVEDAAGGMMGEGRHRAHGHGHRGHGGHGRHKEIPAVGSRAQVFHGNAKHTSGGLTKSDLKKNKWGEIVSKKASAAAKRLDNLGDKRAPPFRSSTVRRGKKHHSRSKTAARRSGKKGGR